MTSNKKAKSDKKNTPRDKKPAQPSPPSGKENPHKTGNPNPDSNLLIVMGLSFLALIPQYLIRSSRNIYYLLSFNLGTYPGDLWYCWDHYLAQGFPFPREYPAGIQTIFMIIHRFKPASLDYRGYMIGICLFLAIFALFTTYLIYKMLFPESPQIEEEVQKENPREKGENEDEKIKKLFLFWILAPSFLFYGLLNLDFLSIFTMMLAFYLFTEKEYYLSASVLALGTTIKVFPFFLAPLFFFQADKKYRWGSVLVFIGCWLAFNLPFMINNWSNWAFPYQWQIKENYAKSAQDGSYFWILYQFLSWLDTTMGVVLQQGSWLWNIHQKLTPYYQQLGKISLLLYGGLYYWFLKKKWDLPITRLALGIMLLFILTDRVYSPQYNLYMLPFLVLSPMEFRNENEKHNFYKAFFIGDLLGVLQVFFLFKLREMPIMMQTIVFTKYTFLIYLFYLNWVTPYKKESPHDKAEPHATSSSSPSSEVILPDRTSPSSETAPG